MGYLKRVNDIPETRDSPAHRGDYNACGGGEAAPRPSGEPGGRAGMRGRFRALRHGSQPSPPVSQPSRTCAEIRSATASRRPGRPRRRSAARRRSRPCTRRAQSFCRVSSCMPAAGPRTRPVVSTNATPAHEIPAARPGCARSRGARRPRPRRPRVRRRSRRAAPLIPRDPPPRTRGSARGTTPEAASAAASTRSTSTSVWVAVTISVSSGRRCAHSS